LAKKAKVEGQRREKSGIAPTNLCDSEANALATFAEFARHSS
jgi:hypothetical protein